MNRLYKFLLFPIILICFSTECFSDEGVNYGEMWLGWSKDDRLLFMWGFSEGQSLIIEEIKSVGSSKQIFKYDISGSDVKIIKDIMTNLYEDASNSYIPWKYMAYIANMKLKGNDQKEIEKQLQLLRQYAIYERSKLKNKK